MKLTKLRIKNLRGIQEETFDLYDYNTFIGPNNAGKSTIIRGIEILLNQEKPDFSELNQSATEQIIEIDGTFEGVEEWERNVAGVSGLICDGKIQLRGIASFQDGKTSLEYQAYVQPIVITGFEDNWSACSDEVKQIATAIEINTATKWKTVANKQRVREKITLERPELVQPGTPIWTSENISIAPALKQAIPQAIIVHAVRDASDEAKPGAKTPFGILLSKKILPAVQATDEYRNFQSAISALSSRIRGVDGGEIPALQEIANDISSAISSVIDARVVIKMDPPEVEKFLGGNTGINLHDGIETPIGLQGHGVQRALLFALIEVLARQDFGNTGRQKSTIILYEEPELYLHPHLMRKLKASLKQIASRDNWQVCVSTHSPFFIEVAESPKSLIILQKSGPNRIEKKQLSVDPFEIDDATRNEREVLRATLDFHPTVAEVFFAKIAILVEGDTEMSVFRHSQGIHNFFGIQDEMVSEKSIISCGGKWTIPAIANILSSFQIPYKIVHDMDRKGRTDEQIAQTRGFDPYRANARIRSLAGEENVMVVEDTFEHLLWPGNEDVDKKEKPFKAWKRIEEIKQTGRPNDYPELKRIFEFVFQ